MDDRHIVAIDLGTSKIAITVAIVNGDDIQIIYYKEGESDGIRASAIFNPARASKQIKKVINEAEKVLGIIIKEVVVCMPKYEVTVQNSEFPTIRTNAEECITAEEIAAIKKKAKEEYKLDDPEMKELFGVVAQSFSTEDEFMLIEKDIEGMIGGYLEANFKVFIGSAKDLKNIDVTFKNLGVRVAEKYFTPESTARAVLYDSEMDNGVALIDFGAGATSVSVYKGNVMRHYASIPFGGNNITWDIKTECNINNTLAENIKLGYGVCMPDRLQNLSEKVLRINSNNPAISSKDLEVKYLSEIITARVTEIIEAMLYEIEQSGCADDLKSGIVVTGGCAEMANCCNLIRSLSGLKVRIGQPKKIFSISGGNEIYSTKAACSVGMILRAKEDNSIDCVWTQDTEVLEKDLNTPLHNNTENEDFEEPEVRIIEEPEVPSTVEEVETEVEETVEETVEEPTTESNEESTENQTPKSPKKERPSFFKRHIINPISNSLKKGKENAETIFKEMGDEQA